jgi:curved DNA-binding protein
MEYKDYYQILGIDRNASQEDVKRAYRKLARQFHPDVNPGDASAEDRFKDINEAYEVLSDPQKRNRYDHLGTSWNQWRSRGSTGGFEDFARQWYTGSGGGSQYVNVEDFLGRGGSLGDLLEGLFGFGGSRSSGSRYGYQQMRRGQDVEVPVELTFEEAFHGTTRRLERSDRRIVTAKIPPGAQTGTRVRLAGQGEPGTGGGPAGDLFLKIAVQPHEAFRREGNDLWLDLDVDLYTAVLGGEVSVETLNGQVMLKIPSGTSSGKVLRLRGKGMPDPKHPRRHGDLYAVVQVQVPSRLTRRERELFEQLAQLQK